jgi:hypothetical protein
MPSTIAKLTRTLKSLAEQAAGADSTAGAILRFVREEKIKKLDDWSAAVAAACEANGWHATRGRPVAGSTATAMPRTVRTYLVEIRNAYRLGVRVWEIESLYDLRKATAEAREKAAAAAPQRKVRPELQGVHVTADQRLIGAPFHDLVVVYQHLKRDEQEKVQRAVLQLVQKHVDHLPPAMRTAAAVVVAAEEPARAAA